MTSIRKVPLVTGQYYHVFNRGIDKRTTFSDLNEYSRAYQIMKYYLSSEPPIRLSMFLHKSEQKQSELLGESWGDKLVSIVCYCLMPNHFHFLLKQEQDGGVSKYMSQFLNSYTRYFNTKNKRVGQLFLDQFKNVLIENESQFLHVSRYIHLNPYSSGIISSLDKLVSYPWSSLPEYLNTSEDYICEKDDIMSNFKETNSYKNFVLDRASYQRDLKLIEKQLIED